MRFVAGVFILAVLFFGALGLAKLIPVSPLWQICLAIGLFSIAVIVLDQNRE